MIRRPPSLTLDRWSAASDLYKRQRVDAALQTRSQGLGALLPGVAEPLASEAAAVDAVAGALAQLHKFPDFSLKHLKYVTTNAVEAAPVAADQPSYPVLIFLEGFTGYRQLNTFQVEALVSHGYIVVGIDQPDDRRQDDIGERCHDQDNRLEHEVEDKQEG